MKIINWIKRKLDRCDDCREKAVYHFEYPPMSEKDEGKDYLKVQYCYGHAIKSGFCCGCGGFFAGCESFDFSKHQGYCDDCYDDFLSDTQDFEDGDFYGDFDYYDDYAHNFDEKQPQAVK